MEGAGVDEPGPKFRPRCACVMIDRLEKNNGRQVVLEDNEIKKQRSEDS